MRAKKTTKKTTKTKKPTNKRQQSKKLIRQYNIESAQNAILESRARFILWYMEERIRLAETQEEINLAINYAKRNLNKKILRTYVNEKLRVGGWNLYNGTKEALAKVFGEDWVKKQLNIKELTKVKKHK